MRIFLCLLALMVAGCQRTLPPAAFLKAYEAEAASSVIAGDYKFLIAPLSPDYLSASMPDGPDDKAGPSSEKSAYQSTHCISLRISLAHPTGGPSDHDKDLVARAEANGNGDHKAGMAFLESDFGANVRLEDKRGRKIPPLSYRFQPGLGLGAVNSFVFLFPKDSGGSPVSLQDAFLIIDDFGMNTGTVKLPVRLVHNLRLKV
jgi:hypothetical protein